MATILTPDSTLTAYFIPLSAVAQWPVPNYDNPETRTWLIPFTVFLSVFSSAAVGLRVYARMALPTRQFGWDDILILGAWVFGIVFTGLTIYGIAHGGFDRHVWDAPPSLASKGGLVAWSSEMIFLFCSALTKFSILVFQRKLIARTNNPWIRHAVDAAIVFTALYLVAFVLVLLLVCSPTSASWESLDITYTKPYHCVNRRVIDPLVGALNVFSDVYALVIPELVIARLQMGRTQKIVLYVIFGSGLLVAGAGLARTVWLSRLTTDRLRDLTWIGYDVLVWTEIELHLGIVCASAPALKALISNMRNGTTRTGTSGGYKSMGTSSELKSFSDKKDPGKNGILVTEELIIKSAMYPPPTMALPEALSKGKRVLGFNQ